MNIKKVFITVLIICIGIAGYVLSNGAFIKGKIGLLNEEDKQLQKVTNYIKANQDNVKDDFSTWPIEESEESSFRVLNSSESSVKFWSDNVNGKDSGKLRVVVASASVEKDTSEQLSIIVSDKDSYVFDESKRKPSLYCVDYNDGDEECSKKPKDFTHTYENEGQQTVTYRVEDKEGRYDEYSMRISLEKKKDLEVKEPVVNRPEKDDTEVKLPFKFVPIKISSINADFKHSEKITSRGLEVTLYNESKGENTEITEAIWTVGNETITGLMKTDIDGDGIGGDIVILMGYPEGDGGFYGPKKVDVFLDVSDGKISENKRKPIYVTKPVKAKFQCNITIKKIEKSSLSGGSSISRGKMRIIDNSVILLDEAMPVSEYILDIQGNDKIYGKIGDVGKEFEFTIGIGGNIIQYTVINGNGVSDTQNGSTFDNCTVTQENDEDSFKTNDFNKDTIGEQKGPLGYKVSDYSKASALDAGRTIKDGASITAPSGATVYFESYCFSKEGSLHIQPVGGDKIASLQIHAKKNPETNSKCVKVVVEKVVVEDRIVEKEVLKETIVYKDKIVEKEVPKETIVYKDKIVEKEVPKETIVYKDKIVEKEVPKETIVYRDSVVYKDKIVEVPKETVVIREKIVEVPKETIVYQDKIVEVPAPPQEVATKEVFVPQNCFFIRDYEAYEDVLKGVHRSYNEIDILSTVNILTKEGYLDPIVHGYDSPNASGRVFLPNRNVTRAESWKMIVRAMCLFDWAQKNQDKLVNSGANKFQDLEREFWGYDEIDVLSQLGAIAGYTNGEVGPDDQITRAAFVKTLLFVFLSQNTDKDCSDETIAKADKFSDVGDDIDNQWYARWAPCARYHGIWLGSEGNLARPNDFVTREEAIIIIYNAIIASGKGGLISR